MVFAFSREFIAYLITFSGNNLLPHSANRSLFVMKLYCHLSAALFQPEEPDDLCPRYYFNSSELKRSLPI